MMADTTTEPEVTGTEAAATHEATSPPTPRYSRRLSDKILEMMLTRRPLTPDGTRRRNMESLVAAHERLWYLRHPETKDQ